MQLPPAQVAEMTVSTALGLRLKLLCCQPGFLYTGVKGIINSEKRNPSEEPETKESSRGLGFTVAVVVGVVVVVLLFCFLAGNKRKIKEERKKDSSPEDGRRCFSFQLFSEDSNWRFRQRI